MVVAEGKLKSRVKISIVIPVKNGASTLESCLKGIKDQTLFDQTEVITIDSASNDKSLVIAQAMIPNIKIISIPAAEFNHGLTRNLGVQHAEGKFVVMTVQDATPADNKWLEKMIRHFEDPEVAGVCGQQVVPHDKDKNPHQWFRPVNAPSVRTVQYKNKHVFESLSPEEKKKACSWDDVNAMYRKEVLKKIPFRQAFFSEDAMWAQDVLRAGYTLVYDTSSRVYHYHHQNYDFSYKRTLTQLYFGYQIFGHRRKLKFSLMDYLKIVYRNINYRAHPKWVLYNFNLIWATKKAYEDFNKWLNLGEIILKENYQNICRKPPQGSVGNRTSIN